MDASKSKDAQQLLAEIHSARHALDTSLAATKRNLSPKHQVAVVARQRAFPYIVGAITVVCGLGIALTLRRQHRQRHAIRNLPERIAEVLHLPPRKVPPVAPSTRRGQRLLKATASIAWKAAMPILLGVIRNQFSPANRNSSPNIL